MGTRLPADLRAPSAARHYVALRLGELAVDEHPPAGDVVLVVSELVTNAVRAGAAVVGLALTVHADRVEVEVTDDADGWPTRREVDWSDVNGRGLAIVDELSDSWRTAERPAGKAVTVTWFRARSTSDASRAAAHND